ncbi:hypothetical protein JB92DRAFT_292711 [Gautieria morchelliformis]|nr:hypothetical protein JB92DRAFT_292711 [Gautieria morchelliformis]
MISMEVTALDFFGRYCENLNLLFLDLYGADDNEFAVPVEPENQPASSTEEVKTSVKEETTATSAPPPPQTSQLPPPTEHKPIPAASIPTASPANTVPPSSYSAVPATAPPVSNGTPYSTQVSQQFSTYQHTIPLVSDRLDHLSERAEIPQVDTTGERSHINVVDRSVRPSEMKDEG